MVLRHEIAVLRPPGRPSETGLGRPGHDRRIDKAVAQAPSGAPDRDARHPAHLAPNPLVLRDSRRLEEVRLSLHAELQALSDNALLARLRRLPRDSAEREATDGRSRRQRNRPVALSITAALCSPHP